MSAVFKLRRGRKASSHRSKVTPPPGAAASLLSQELWDQIIDHLHDDNGALKSSVLICRAFVQRAQLHLFRCLRLRSWDDPFPTTLEHFISRSSHLLDHVCDLSIWRCDANLTLLAHLPWPRLSTISVSHYLKREISLPAIDLLCILVSLPTLRSLSISSTSFTLEEIHTILASCSSNVLSFRFCGKPEISQTAIRNLPLTRTELRPRITHLDLCIEAPSFSSIVVIPLDSGGPFDLSCLTHFSSGWFLAQLPRVVLGVQHTLQHLEIMGLEPGIEFLDFGTFPVLSQITMKLIGPPGMDAIAHSTRSSVRAITCHAYLPSLATKLVELETAILAADMPKLACVEVRAFKYPVVRAVSMSRVARWTAQIRGQRTPVEIQPTDEQLLELAKEQMPALRQRGILVVEVTELSDQAERASWN
ncbi:hypothetical protein DFH06DRAFT_1467576 [Mycena polygramma]|nr:hypothetical protein DFH06DRAFT_1467576 [Mycena polygramma]